MKRVLSAVACAAVVAGGSLTLVSPAQAAPQGPQGCAYESWYKVKTIKTVYKPTKVTSGWSLDRDNPTVEYSGTKTATGKAEGTAKLGAEAGKALVKVSGEISGSVGKSWSKTTSWKFSAKAKNKTGKTKVRGVMFHEYKKAYLVKNYVNGNCKTVKQNIGWVTAPRKENVNVWGLQYK